MVVNMSVIKMDDSRPPVLGMFFSPKKGRDKMKKRWILGSIVLALSILAGCGGGEEVAMPEPKASQHESQEPTQEPAPQEEREPAHGILLSTTIGPVDAGLIDALIEAYTKENPDRTVRYLARGTGKAIEIAEGGNIDMLIVHAKSLEEAFIEEGYGTERIPLMYNDFVLVGPKEDPAQVGEAESAVAALQAIEEGGHPFVSRADQSGTHVKELEVWAEAGIQPEGDWYEKYEKGAEGNKGTLLYTDQQGAYTIMDRATFIANEDQLENLVVLFEGEDILYNYISIVPVNPDTFDNIYAEEAADFIDWLTSQEAQDLIANFGVEEFGEPLFFPNAQGYEPPADASEANPDQETTQTDDAKA